ncbi:MAG TPA: protoglobin family protein [Myxococcales bacterium]|nr:protoglobin family protein [Myxococcales bacterium]
MEPKQIDVRAIARDPSARMRFMMDFVGYTVDDQAALQESVPVLGPVLPRLLDALYERLLSFDDTRRVFMGKQGEVDPSYIALRKEHLTQWVLRTAGVAGEPDSLPGYLREVGRRHTGVAGETDRVVPPRYMVGLVGFVQAALWGALFDALPDKPKDVARFGLAWSKMLVIQLELFLKVIAPQWPDWDEAP